jgi:hypothetical protein
MYTNVQVKNKRFTITCKIKIYIPSFPFQNSFFFMLFPKKGPIYFKVKLGIRTSEKKCKCLPILWRSGSDSDPGEKNQCGSMLQRIRNTVFSPLSLLTCTYVLPTSKVSASLVAVLHPYVFGPPGTGSGSFSQRYGSGSFNHQAKIVRKPLIPTVL